MNKNDIKIGMVVETRDEDLYFIKEREGDIILAGKDTWSSLSTYSDELKWCLNGKEHLLDIMKIYKCDAYSIDTLFHKEYLTLLWERKRKIDWNKVPEWTKVQVRDCNNSEWKNAYLLGYNNETFSVSATRRDKFTYDGICSAWWRQCKIHESVEIKEEWYR